MPLTKQQQDYLDERKALAQELIKGNEIAYVANQRKLAAKGLKKAHDVLVAEIKVLGQSKSVAAEVSENNRQVLSFLEGLVAYFEPPKSEDKKSLT